VPSIFGSVHGAAVLVRYTRYGDADLNRVINLDDFNRLAANFGSTDAFWHEGDFNYDTLVNLADFNLMAANFGLAASGAQVTPHDWAALASAVPEPVAGIWLIGSAAVFARRRRGN
jgi:hypothetical protein